jgi:hypothetical protein
MVQVLVSWLDDYLNRTKLVPILIHIYKFVVIVNTYRYCVCYTNGDVSYKL